MQIPSRRKPGRKKRCHTDGCKNHRLEGMRYCHKCTNRVTREMRESGYLEPEQREQKFFYENGLQKFYY